MLTRSPGREGGIQDCPEGFVSRVQFIRVGSDRFAHSSRVYVQLPRKPRKRRRLTPPAPTDRTKRVREARDEAKKEIEAYRANKEAEYKEFEAQVLPPRLDGRRGADRQ